MKSAYKTLLSSLQKHYDEREAQSIARWVMEECFELSFTDLCMGKDTQLSSEELTQLANIIERLSNGEPMQYVLGKAYFYGLPLRVNPSTLIPRPETEDLVEWVFQHRHHLPPRILDVGTGSGCIALSLKHLWCEADIMAWDISAEALATAQRNGSDLALAIKWQQQDLFEATAQDLPTDWHGDYVLISNPPYVCESEKNEMTIQVKDFEPSTALFVADERPCIYYEALAHLAEATRPTMVCCEINEALGKETMQEFRKVGYTQTLLLNDRFGHRRFVMAQREGTSTIFEPDEK